MIKTLVPMYDRIKAIRDKTNPTKPEIHQWTIKEVERLGFKVMQNHDGWCRMRGWGYDLYHNFDVNNNLTFQFQSTGNYYGGHFTAKIPDELAFVILIHCVGRKEK